jgi:hypothetical protein
MTRGERCRASGVGPARTGKAADAMAVGRTPGFGVELHVDGTFGSVLTEDVEVDANARSSCCRLDVVPRCGVDVTVANDGCSTTRWVDPLNNAFRHGQPPPDPSICAGKGSG